MEVKDIIEIFEKWGLGGVFVFLALMGSRFFAKSEWVNNFFTKLVDKILGHKEKETYSKGKVISEIDILNHDIFNYIDFWILSKIPTFNFSTDYRTAIFRKYLTIFLRNHKENLKSYINRKEFETMTDSELWASLLKLINDITYDYEKEMESIGIPQIIIEKMKVRNNDSISLTIDLIEGICNSQFYNSEGNFLKIYSILNIMLSVLENTISNSDRICNDINGQLKGMEFEGKKEP